MSHRTFQTLVFLTAALFTIDGCRRKETGSLSSASSVSKKLKKKKGGDSAADDEKRARCLAMVGSSLHLAEREPKVDASKLRVESITTSDSGQAERALEVTVNPKDAPKDKPEMYGNYPEVQVCDTDNNCAGPGGSSGTRKIPQWVKVVPLKNLGSNIIVRARICADEPRRKTKADCGDWYPNEPASLNLAGVEMVSAPNIDFPEMDDLLEKIDENENKRAALVEPLVPLAQQCLTHAAGIKIDGTPIAAAVSEAERLIDKQSMLAGAMATTLMDEINAETAAAMKDGPKELANSGGMGLAEGTADEVQECARLLGEEEEDKVEEKDSVKESGLGMEQDANGNIKLHSTTIRGGSGGSLTGQPKPAPDVGAKSVGGAFEPIPARAAVDKPDPTSEIVKFREDNTSVFLYSGKSVHGKCLYINRLDPSSSPSAGWLMRSKEACWQKSTDFDQKDVLRYDPATGVPGVSHTYPFLPLPGAATTNYRKWAIEPVKHDTADEVWLQTNISSPDPTATAGRACLIKEALGSDTLLSVAACTAQNTNEAKFRFIPFKRNSRNVAVFQDVSSGKCLMFVDNNTTAGGDEYAVLRPCVKPGATGVTFFDPKDSTMSGSVLNPVPIYNLDLTQVDGIEEVELMYDPEGPRAEITHPNQTGEYTTTVFDFAVKSRDKFLAVDGTGATRCAYVSKAGDVTNAQWNRSLTDAMACWNLDTAYDKQTEAYRYNAATGAQEPLTDFPFMGLTGNVSATIVTNSGTTTDTAVSTEVSSSNAKYRKWSLVPIYDNMTDFVTLRAYPPAADPFSTQDASKSCLVWHSPTGAPSITSTDLYVSGESCEGLDPETNPELRFRMLPLFNDKITVTGAKGESAESKTGASYFALRMVDLEDLNTELCLAFKTDGTGSLVQCRTETARTANFVMPDRFRKSNGQPYSRAEFFADSAYQGKINPIAIMYLSEVGTAPDYKLTKDGGGGGGGGGSITQKGIAIGAVAGITMFLTGIAVAAVFKHYNPVSYASGVKKQYVVGEDGKTLRKQYYTESMAGDTKQKNIVADGKAKSPSRLKKGLAMAGTFLLGMAFAVGFSMLMDKYMLANDPCTTFHQSVLEANSDLTKLKTEYAEYQDKKDELAIEWLEKHR